MKGDLYMVKQFIRVLSLVGIIVLMVACSREQPVSTLGVAIPGYSEANQLTSLVAPTPAAGLEVVITETGKLSLSSDGLGTNSSSGGSIQVNKPNASATVRSAYLTCASSFGRIINDGEISLDGNPITWSRSVQNNAGSNATFFNNVFANVTSIVKPKVDAAAPGDVNFTQVEVNSGSIDGCGLYVIFNDPTQPSDKTVVLLFGGQDTNGETFNITLAEAINKSNPNLVLDLSLAISFSTGNSQHSEIDVNSQRLTTSAGGFDDGQPSNGALLTVGGIGDTNANPSDPNSTASTLDDELYNLIPFVNNGDTTITVFTTNPSDDDNIFAGALVLSSAAIVNEGILLSPATATNPVNTSHTVTAKVQNDQGNPIVGRTVTFKILSGPHAGLTGTGTTNASGVATFSYTGTSAGTDQIQASFVNSQGQTVTSNTVTKIWQGVTTDTTKPVCRVQSTTAGPPVTLNVFIQDTGSGLASIKVVTADNVNTIIPVFTVGSKTSLIVKGVKVDQTKKSRLELEVKDVAGNVTLCDPVIVNLAIDANNAWGRTSVNVSDIPEIEGQIRIENSGASVVRIKVNDGATNVFNVDGTPVAEHDATSDMKAGSNSASVVLHGAPGSSAVVMFHDGSASVSMIGLQHLSANLNLDWY